jgi:hypothetical protein
VLEDIHTSHPAHAIYQDELGSGKGLSRRIGAALGQAGPAPATALSVLLALEQQLRLGSGRPLPDSLLRGLERGFVKAGQVRQLHAQIEGIDIYRRAQLPLRCYRCGSEDFDYHALRCVCGEAVYAEADSMSIVVRKAR